MKTPRMLRGSADRSPLDSALLVNKRKAKTKGSLTRPFWLTAAEDAVESVEDAGGLLQPPRLRAG